jgi:hypothetical protein
MTSAAWFRASLRRAALVAAGIVVWISVGVRAGDAAAAPRFNRDIRPILSDRCFTCHGPDANKREAELRLDTEEGAHKFAIVPGDAVNRELLARVMSDDPEYQMPPPGSKK